MIAAAVAAAAALAAAGVSCPLDGVGRGGRPDAWLRTTAAKVLAASTSPRCRLLGLAVLDRLDLHGEDACVAWRRLAAEPADADLRALRGRLAWRCGQAVEAHRDALAALDEDPSSAAAWTLLGDVLAARFLDDAAAAAFDRALAIDADDPEALFARVGVTASRSERRALLRRFVAAAHERGTTRQRLRAALETLEFLEALADRDVFVVEKAELPGEIRLSPMVIRPGSIAGWIARIGVGEAGTLPALFDTGASGLHLDARAAEKARLAPLSGVTLVGGGGSGEHAVRRGLLARLDLGPLVYRQALAVSAMDSLHPRGTYRAILGADLFAGTALTFDFPRRRLEVRDVPAQASATGDPRRVDPWPRDPDALPLLRVAGMLLVPARLSAGTTTIERPLLFDTGASRTMIARAAAESFRGLRHGARRGARGYGGAMEVVGTLPRLTIDLGAATGELRDVPVFDLSARTRVTGINVGGFVGNDWLARRRVTLDLVRGVLVVAPDAGRRSGRRR
ncbi:MAG: hypothetical protein Kow0062_12050 [Acidobacteriota bacterium]